MSDLKIRLIVSGASDNELGRIMDIMDNTANRLRANMDRWVTVEVLVAKSSGGWKRRRR